MPTGKHEHIKTLNHHCFPAILLLHLFILTHFSRYCDLHNVHIDTQFTSDIFLWQGFLICFVFQSYGSKFPNMVLSLILLSSKVKTMLVTAIMMKMVMINLKMEEYQYVGWFPIVRRGHECRMLVSFENRKLWEFSMTSRKPTTMLRSSSVNLLSSCSTIFAGNGSIKPQMSFFYELFQSIGETQSSRSVGTTWESESQLGISAWFSRTSDRVSQDWLASFTCSFRFPRI